MRMTRHTTKALSDTLFESGGRCVGNRNAVLSLNMTQYLEVLTANDVF
jgi:hypothetical protein